MSDPTFDRRAAEIRSRSAAARTALLNVMAEPEAVQRELLASILRRNEMSEFGRQHDFPALRDAADFARVVPIRIHEEFKPWLDMAIAGKPGVLADEDPFAYFSSSGTTGAEKHIPVTASYLRESFIPFYFAGLASVLDNSPGVLADDNAVLNLWQDPYSPIDRTAGGQPHIGPSQVDYRGLGENLAVGLGNRAAWSELPEHLRAVDPLHRTYLRLRIAAEYDIRCVFAINPAIAHALPEQLSLWWPRIVQEIRDGTLDGKPFAAPDRERAVRIETLANWFGTVRPKDLWPRLSGVVTWTGYIAGMYLPGMAQEYGPGVRIIAAPLGSCEGPLATPIDRHPSAAPLVTPACFFEFVPAEEELRADTETLLAHEIEPGRDYQVVLTRVGGLYRCATRDIVRVVGFVGRTPRIGYGGRQGDLTAAGAPVREDQVVRAASKAAADSGLAVGNLVWRLRPGSEQDVPRHEAAVAFQQDEPAAEVRRFADLLDVYLGVECPGYSAARRDGTLDVALVHQVPVSAFFAGWLDRVRAGQRPPRVKDRVFDGKSPVWAEVAS
jgi:GH3 auxin-responsive promoter